MFSRRLLSWLRQENGVNRDIFNDKFQNIDHIFLKHKQKFLESVISFCASCFYTRKSTFKSVNKLLQRLLTFSNIDFDPEVS